MRCTNLLSKMLCRPQVAMVALLMVGLVGVSHACNIPVFRYALERWRSDDYEIVIYYDAPLTESDEKWVQELETKSSEKQGGANAIVHRLQIDSSQDAERLSMWKALSEKSDMRLPYVTVQLKTNRGTSIDAWHGPLSSAKEAHLLDSPVRSEIGKRLLNGHSIVWLMLKSGNATADTAMAEMLEKQCNDLQTFIQLPDGIGLPGSELFAEVPLLVKFSYMQIDPSNREEQLLIHQLTHYHGQPDNESQTLIAPIFGRGRMLEVIPAEDVSPELIRDLTMFMSGACSCQVKDRNPGVDLLMSRRWDSDLFGENGIRPPLNDQSPRPSEPVILAIPPGRKK